MTANQSGLRVGFLSTQNPQDPNAVSGMPFSAFHALRDEGLNVIELSIHDTEAPTPLLARWMDKVPFGSASKSVLRRARNKVRRLKEKAMTPWEYDRTIREAIRRSRRTQEKVESSNVDVLVGVCMSTMLYQLETTVPIVYASDTTAKLINESYPTWQSRSKGYQRACDEIERAALQRCAIFAAPSKCTMASAINDYNVPEERVRLVELGSHVVPSASKIDPAPPSRDDLQLVLVAADPYRKRLDLCIEIAELLQDRGWNVTLNYIGPEHPRAKSSPVVHWHGRLRLSDPDDRRIHEDVLSRSHWMLLPSLAEAFGIAPGEAAHFGRPSLVSDVGGLPTVVQDGKTGFVLTVDAPAAAYADALESVSTDPSRYAEMSAAALERAQTKLTWGAWARRIHEILLEVAPKEVKAS